MRILVPLDGSELAEQALATAADLSRRSAPPAPISVVRVVTYAAIAFEAGAPGVLGALDAAALDARAYLQALATRTDLAGLTIQPQVYAGIPADAIAACAVAEAVDLIVLSSHGRTGMAHMTLGSVAEAVANSSRVPTLIMRPQAPHLPLPARDEQLTILVALDGSDQSEMVLAPAVALAQQVGGALRLLRVLPAVGGPSAMDQAQVDAAYDYLTQLRQRYATPTLPIHIELAWGDPVEQIAIAALSHRTDIVAMATHGRTGLARWRQGSVTFAVMHRLELPVLALRPTDSSA